MLQFSRADFITGTGVIMPYDVRHDSPVDAARRIIDPFIEAVRPAGPAVSPAATIPTTGTVKVEMPGTTAAVAEYV